MSCAVVSLGLILAVSAGAQYPGKVAKPSKPEPVLRSVAVLEWTGEPGKPSASRLVPVAVYDGEQLNDGTIYMTRPEPLGLQGGTEYELQTAGKASGLFDVFGAGDINGSWQGFGVWKPLSKAEAARAAGALNTSSLYAPVDAPEDDKPVLKRKHPKGTDGDEPAASSKTADENGSGKKTADSPASGKNDSDGPKLKRKDSDDAAADPDRPTLKRKASDDSAAGGSAGAKSPASATQSSTAKAEDDPDRPTIRRKRHTEDEAGNSNVAPDPDRPRLKHGKPEESGGNEPTRLVGYPASMQQAVAVSDARDKADHPWKYSWANPEDELKMKEAMEAVARTALGLDVPAAPAKPVRKTAAGKPVAVAKRPLKPVTPAEPVELADEHFRVFELAYGSSATMVLTASTPLPELPGDSAAVAPVAAAGDNPPDDPSRPVVKYGKPKAAASATPPASVPSKGGKTPAVPVKPAPQKFVTIIGQPDLYGGLQVLYKGVTDSARLDETPRMLLVDAVDAMGDNRGELLFELRGATQRQFVMYRVLRGSAEQLFATVAIPTDPSRAAR